MAFYPAYNRFSRPALLVEGSGHALDALHDVIHSMGAIAPMMRALLEEGEDQSHISEHVYRLLDQQYCLLAGVCEEFKKEETERREAADKLPKAAIEALPEPARKLRTQFIESNAQAGVDYELIGAALGCGGAEVARVVGVLRGEPAAHKAAQAPKDIAAQRLRTSAQA